MKITKTPNGYHISITVPFWLKCLIFMYLAIYLSNLIDKSMP